MLQVYTINQINPMGSSHSSEPKLNSELFNQEPLRPLDPVTDEEQIKFEQLVTVLVLVELFCTHCLFGSAEKQTISLDDLSREFVRKRFQSTGIPTEFVEKVSARIPGRLIQDMSMPIIFPYDMEKDFKANPEYYLPMVEEKIQFFKSLDQEELTDELVKTVCTSCRLGRTNLELIEFLSTDEKLLETFSTARFKGNSDLSNKPFESKIAYLKSLDRIGIYRSINVSDLSRMLVNKLNSDIEFARNHIYQLIQSLTRESFADSIFDDVYCWKCEKYMFNHSTNKLEEVESVDEDDESVDDEDEELVDGEDEGGPVEPTEPDDSIISKLRAIETSHQEKYYRDVYSKAHLEKVKYNYYLNFADYWVLYQLDPTLVKDIVQSCFLVDDYTFCEYKHSWDFLDSLNPRVKQNIITKYNSDKKRVIKNRYGTIESLEDLVDIVIFCQFPPTFLRLQADEGTQYYRENEQVLFELLESYGWDMGKLDYLNWDLVISYNLVRK